MAFVCGKFGEEANRDSEDTRYNRRDDSSVSNWYLCLLEQRYNIYRSDPSTCYKSDKHELSNRVLLSFKTEINYGRFTRRISLRGFASSLRNYLSAWTEWFAKFTLEWCNYTLIFSLIWCQHSCTTLWQLGLGYTELCCRFASVSVCAQVDS